MSDSIRIEEAVRLHAAETRWLDQARARLRTAAPQRPHPQAQRSEEASR